MLPTQRFQFFRRLLPESKPAAVPISRWWRPVRAPPRLPYSPKTAWSRRLWKWAGHPLATTEERVRAVDRQLRQCQLRHREGRASRPARSVCRELARLARSALRTKFFLRPQESSAFRCRRTKSSLAWLNCVDAARAASSTDSMRFAHAIMTTDTRPKLASAQFRSGKIR